MGVENEEAAVAVPATEKSSEEQAARSKQEKKRKKKEKKERKSSSKKPKIDDQQEPEPEQQDSTTVTSDEDIKALEQAYQKALQAFKADKSNKDLRRAKTAAKKAWDTAVIANAGPNAEAIVCRNCSQLFVFQDQEKFQERNWDNPIQCKDCVGKEILRAQDRSKVDSKQNMCYEFQKTGTCSRGDRCKFSHAKQHVGEKRLAARPMCRSIEQGKECPHGKKCRFRHEPEE